MKLVLSGPTHSGKSCFREGLKQALREIGVYGYVITACPDGEGSWYQEAVAKNAGAAAKCKAAYRGSFSAAFVERIAESVEKCRLPMVLVDIGGRTSPENRRICKTVDAAVILSSSEEGTAEWRAFWASMNVPVVSEIRSDYNGTTDVADDVQKMVVHHLERGEDLHQRPAIRMLAAWLASRAN